MLAFNKVNNCKGGRIRMKMGSSVGRGSVLGSTRPLKPGKSTLSPSLLLLISRYLEATG